MINLEKGQELNLTKKFSLNKIRIGAGWDPAVAGKNIDLDLIAVALDEKNKRVGDEYFNFFNNKISPNNSMVHSNDDRTGASSNGGDDEFINIDLSKLPANTKSVYIYLVSFSGQKFKTVNNEYVAISDVDNGTVLARYDFDSSDNEHVENMTGVECAKFFKNEDGEWNFKALVFPFGSNGGLGELMERLQDIEL